MPLLAGCDFFEDITPTTELSAVSASFNDENRTLTWVVDPYAVKYEVVVNQVIRKTFSDFGTPDLLSYDLTNALKDNEWMYRFYVLAYDSVGNTRKSQDYTYEYEVEEQNPTITTIAYDNLSMTPSSVDFKKDKSLLSWDTVSNVTSYIVVIATSSSDVLYVPCEDRSLNVYQYTKDNDIFMLNVGVQVGNTLYLSENNQKYYNTETSGEALSAYTSKVYYFDDQYNDYFISNQEQLDNFFYYSYIYKHKTSTFQCASNFVNDKEALTTKLAISKDNLHESYAYKIEIQKIDIYKSIYTLIFDFYEQEEPSKTTGDIAVQYYGREFEPYFETYQGTKGVTSFATDYKPVSYTVSTSDQLCHVVESGAKPKFASTSSSAYRMYTQAKEVLNTIICESMTDYEKALSIFDWLVVSCQYDQNVQSLIASDGKGGATTTSYNCFYLEGVFVDHVAVCDGYSKAYSLLCNMLGIDCARIVGVAGSGLTQGNHAWNKVKIGDMWYVVDITWANKIKTINYLTSYEIGTHTYFMVSDYEISGYDYKSGSHLASDKSTYETMPATDDSMNYYNYMSYRVEDKEYSRYIHGDIVAYYEVIMQDIQKYIIASPTHSLEVFIDVQIFRNVEIQLGIYGLGYLKPLNNDVVIEIGLSDHTYARGYVVLIHKAR